MATADAAENSRDPSTSPGMKEGFWLWQQQSDESAFFRQKRFGYKQECIIPGTFFIAVCRQNCGAHCQCAWRFVPRRFYAAECSERILIPSQAKPRQPERCAGQPVPRLLFDKDISFAL